MLPMCNVFREWLAVRTMMIMMMMMLMMLTYRLQLVMMLMMNVAAPVHLNCQSLQSPLCLL